MSPKLVMRFVYSRLVGITSGLLNPNVGPKSNFFIRADYTVRNLTEAYDDTSSKDEWQREVYETAAKIAGERGLSSICDFGCGSAYKLVRHFKNLRTIGIELPPALDYLRATYPDREWMHGDLNAVPVFPIDLFIASDVIEHLPNPGLLIRYILKVSPKLIVFSTPDRLLMGVSRYAGPPLNTAHHREWTFREFRAYISDSFIVERQFISNYRQGTQCLVCRPRL